MPDEIRKDEQAGGVATLEKGDRQDALAGEEEQAHSVEEDIAPMAGGLPNIGVLLDIDMKVTVELGRTHMQIRDIMNLSPGSVVELGKAPSEPVDILVNGVLMAKGEVVVVDDHFAVRISRLMSREDRAKKLL